MRGGILREVNRLSSVYEALAKGNPLKHEEIKFIKEVLKELQEKPLEEFDLSKLEKIVEIADRLTVEDGDKLAFEFWAKVYALYAIVRTQKWRLEEEKRRKTKEKQEKKT